MRFLSPIFFTTIFENGRLTQFVSGYFANADSYKSGLQYMKQH